MSYLIEAESNSVEGPYDSADANAIALDAHKASERMLRLQDAADYMRILSVRPATSDQA